LSVASSSPISRCEREREQRECERSERASERARERDVLRRRTHTQILVERETVLALDTRALDKLDTLADLLCSLYTHTLPRYVLPSNTLTLLPLLPSACVRARA
jgi:hypothetical protein